MSISFACAGCGKKFNVADNLAGRKGKCQNCGTVFLIPAAAAAAPPIGRSRPAPPDEDDFGTTFTPPPRRRKKGGSGMKMTAMISGGVLLLALLVLGGWWFFFSSSGLPAEAKYLPDDCVAIAYIDVEEVFDSAAYKSAKQKFGQEIDKGLKGFEKDMGFPATDVASVLAGMPASERDSVAVIKLKKSVTGSQLISGKSVKEEKVGGATLYAPEFGEAFALVDSKTVLFGRKEGLKKVLERGGKPKMTEGMKAALKEADFSKTVTVAFDGKSVAKEAAGAIPPGTPLGDVSGIVAGIEGGALNADLGSDLKISATVLCKDSSTAEQLKKKADEVVNFAKLGLTFLKTSGDVKVPKAVLDEAEAALNSLTMSASGSKFKASLKIKVEPLIEAAGMFVSDRMMPPKEFREERRFEESRPSPAPPGFPKPPPGFPGQPPRPQPPPFPPPGIK